MAAMKFNKKGNYVLVVCPNPSVDIYAHLGRFEVGAPNRLEHEERYPGGKGLHVAMALAEMNIPVVMAGIWGGVTGEWIRKACNRYYPDIPIKGPEIDQWSRSCYTFKSDNGFDDTEILGNGPIIDTATIAQLFEVVSRYLPDAKAIALSGSWPKGATGDEYKQLIQLARLQKVPAFLDCTGLQLTHALKAYPYCVHLNRKEVTDHFQTDGFREAWQFLISKCEKAAITDGSKGLYYLNGEACFHSLVKIDKVISTIGSGDCLLAGIIAGHVWQLSDQPVADHGAAFGAANCLREELGMLYKQDVERLIKDFLPSAQNR